MNKKYYQKNRLKILQHQKEYYYQNREKRLKYAKQRAIKKGIFKGTYGRGKKLSEEHKKNISLGEKGKKVPIRVRKKISITHKARAYLHPNWRGGITSQQKKLRHSIEFRLWREAVFARDNWTCQECQVRGNRLHPHHIKRVSEYPELIFDIQNGVTLCEDCHKKTESWGRPKRNVQYFLALSGQKG